MSNKALNANIIYSLFNSVNMHRWNDHLRTMDLTELDKQAHKAAIVWILGKYEEGGTGTKLNWKNMIEHTLFSFIQRLVLTDLKPQVFHRITKERMADVNTYVMQEFDHLVPDSDPEFRKRMQAYFDSSKDSKEDAIIRAAHYLATKWEFDMIYDANRSMYGIDNTRTEIDKQIYQHMDLEGVKKLTEDRSSFNFLDLIGQLRFQKRWVRTPRMPQTTVLGHSLMVASMAYLNDLDQGADDARVYIDYYTALFHDLPEVLTKDVISPVKTNIAGLSDLLEGYERELVESKIMPLIPESWHSELEYLVYDPFSDKDIPGYGFRGGVDLKACDLLAAYLEAHVSICYGISSRTPVEGREELKEKLKKNGKGICAMDLIAQFESMSI